MGYAISRGNVRSTSGSGAPVGTPARAGDTYIDTAGGQLWFGKNNGGTLTWAAVVTS